MSQDRDLDPVQRSGDGGAEEMLVALVVRMSDEGAAGGQQLRTGRLDEDVTMTVGAVEGEPMVGAGVVAGLELGLGDGRGEGDVPQGGGVVHVRLAARQVAQEGQLGDPLGLRGDRRVELVPVH